MPRQIQAQRTKTAVVTELDQCRRHRDFAARTLNLTAFNQLVERIDDLLGELFSMREEE